MDISVNNLNPHINPPPTNPPPPPTNPPPTTNPHPTNPLYNEVNYTPPINNSIFDKFNQSLINTLSLSNIFLFIWFLIIYLVIFYIIKAFYHNESDLLKEKQALSRTIDMFIFGVLIVIIIYSYYTLSDENKKNIILNSLVWIKDFYNNPNTFFNLSIFIIIFYCFIYFCGVPMSNETRPVSIHFLEKNLWIILLSVIFVDFFKYILDIPIIDWIFGDNDLMNYFNSLKPSTINDNILDISNTIPVTKKPEVFNIANNLYNYDDAQTVCKSFDSRLATVDEINQAYENGAEWCVNSWSADRQVLFPTQQSTYNKLQKIKGAENRCGRTGVNGGRIDNTKLRFGVNCYGIKPDPSNVEKERINNISEYVQPKTKEEIITDAKINFWKKNKDKFIVLNPFNELKWNEN